MKSCQQFNQYAFCGVYDKTVLITNTCDGQFMLQFVALYICPNVDYLLNKDAVSLV